MIFPASGGGQRARARAYSTLCNEAFVATIRGWGLTAMRLAIAREPCAIALDPAGADLLLSFLGNTEPGRLTAMRTEALADRLGVMTSAFSELSDMDRLVLDASRREGFLDKIRDRFVVSGLWRGDGPVGASVLVEPMVCAAFGGGTFHQSAATYIHTRVKRSVLLPPGRDFTPPVISPVLFWCLIALSLVPEGKGRQRIRARRAHDEVCNSALMLAARPNWAGFWEQWILKEFMSAWHGGRAEALTKSLRTLPLIAEGAKALDWLPPAAADDGKDANETADAASVGTAVDIEPTTNWVEMAPGFAERLLMDAI